MAASSVSSNTICSGETATFTPAGGASSYTLTSSTSTLTSSPYTVSPTATTVYTLTGTGSNGCVSTLSSQQYTASITVSTSPTIAIGTISSNTLCSGQSVTITPTGAAANNYTLTPGGLSGPSFTVSPTSTTVYTISGASSAGCVSTASSNLTTTITVYSTPTVGIASVSNNTICSGGASVLTPNGATSYTLLPTGTVGTSFTVSPTTTTIYTLNGNNASGCVNVAANNATVQISVDNFVLQTQVTNISCNGYADGSIGLNLLAGVTNYTYTWSNSATTPTITALGTGSYTVIVKSINNCLVTQTFTIIEPLGLSISTNSTSQASCIQNPTGFVNVNFAGGTAPYTAVWSNGYTGFNNNNIPAGTYTATVSDFNNCVKNFTFLVDTIGLNNAQCVDLFIPEIFTPNGNGKNDLFVISKIDAFPNNTLSIFNRWGSLVYQKKKYSNDWNGKANVSDAMGNNLLPAGTYFIVLDFGDNVSKPYNGYIELQY